MSIQDSSTDINTKSKNNESINITVDKKCIIIFISFLTVIFIVGFGSNYISSSSKVLTSVVSSSSTQEMKTVNNKINKITSAPMQTTTTSSTSSVAPAPPPSSTKKQEDENFDNFVQQPTETGSSKEQKNHQKAPPTSISPDVAKRVPGLIDQLLKQYQISVPGVTSNPGGVAYRRFIPVEAISFMRSSSSASTGGGGLETKIRLSFPANGDVQSLPALSSAEVRQATYIHQQRPVSPGLGLSTQLLTYIHFIAAAQLARTRIVIFPPNIRTSWFSLVNMSATSFPGHPLIYVSSDVTASHVYGIRGGVTTKSYFKWTRENTREHPPLIKRKILTVFERKAAGRPVIRIPVMYKRYPFGAEDKMNFGKHTCGLVFHSKIEQAALLLLDTLEIKVKNIFAGGVSAATSNAGIEPFSLSPVHPPFPWSSPTTDGSFSSSSALPYLIPKVRYVSVHLRIEGQDSVAFRRKSPTPEQLERWFRTVVAEICRRHQTPNVYIASGSIDPSYLEALRNSKSPSSKIMVREGVAMNIFTKNDLLPHDKKDFFDADPYFYENKTLVHWEGKEIFPTNTKVAAVDALVLQHGVAAILTSFSSLTPFIYSRRCYDGPRCLGKLYGLSSSKNKKKKHKISNYLYEIQDDGMFTNAIPYQCEQRMADLLVGGGVRDPEVDLFEENPSPGREKKFAIVK